MTMDRPAVTVTDTHPRRPEVLKFLAQHVLCCLGWYVHAGSCSAEGSGGSHSTDRPAGEFEDAVAQRLDFFSAHKELAPRLKQVVNIIIKHGPVHSETGDPGGRTVEGFFVESKDGLISYELGLLHW